MIYDKYKEENIGGKWHECHVNFRSWMLGT